MPAHQTEAGGIVNVDEICSPWDLIAVSRGGLLGRRDVPFPCGLIGSATNFEGGLVLLLQLLADLMERRQLPPTSSDGARAGYAVALTCRLHASFDDLQTEEASQKESHLQSRRNLTTEPANALQATL